jgi:hypothetical protein
MSLLRAKGSGALAERFSTLSDLVGQAIRFAESHPIAEVLSRKHVLRLLESIQELGGRARRAELGKIIGLAEANLSRVISNLVTAGLIERKSAGREAELNLTSVAIESLKNRRLVRQGVTADPRSSAHEDWTRWPIPIALWSDDPKLSRHNAAFNTLMSADTEAAKPTTFADWLHDLRKRSIEVEEVVQGAGWDVLFRDGRLVRVNRAVLPDGASVTACFDIDRGLEIGREKVHSLEFVADAERSVSEVWIMAVTVDYELDPIYHPTITKNLIEGRKYKYFLSPEIKGGIELNVNKLVQSFVRNGVNNSIIKKNVKAYKIPEQIVIPANLTLHDPNSAQRRAFLLPVSTAREDTCQIILDDEARDRIYERLREWSKNGERVYPPK